jgi:hypothetical protein
MTLWLRGWPDLDQVDVTLDFRDQEMWTEPLQSETTRISAGSSWTEFTVSATAPVDTARPVFHTRLTIAAAPGAIIDVDAISMTTD